MSESKRPCRILGSEIAGTTQEAHNIPLLCCATSSFNAHCPSIPLPFFRDRINSLCFSLYFTSFNKMLSAHVATL